MQRGQAGGNNQDNGYDFLWVMALVFGIIFAVWYFGKSHIAHVIYQTKMYEINALQYAFGYWNELVQKFHLPAFFAIQAKDLSEWMQAIQEGKVAPEYKMLLGILTDVGSYLRYPAVIILLLFAYIVYTKSVVLKFKTVFNMKTMRQYEQEDWPQITPI